ncbi:nucleosome-remodeling factor subunit BPTF-like isoform X2 [Saccostrea echinata]|uniref:nucleosome-remodeling factor subunit BPTF-like isoform X2 n=1 Tax=Saccostrea echinata TaxID=191078 RepID=UPI002A836816|nr:nucleosome-remodeling factor subunit BPTF-like isoform X2 [Saccostrea echinata]
MSGRGRRARGRPPKTPLSTNRTNFLRKPKAYQARSDASSDPNSRSSTPVSIPGTPTRGRGRSREASYKGRNFIHSLFDEDEASRSSMDPEERSSDVAEDIEPLDEDSDSVYDESDSDYSDDSYSTQSSTSKRKLFYFRRPKTPELLDDKDIPQLDLPSSSNDLLIPSEYLMMCLGVYEVIRHFRVILRLSPFTFEDFCAALYSDEVSTLLNETHITLLKSLLREEDGNNTTFGPTDLKDSINASLYFIDSMTWPELVRSYLDSDRLSENKEALEVLEKSTEYPFVSFQERLKVLKVLTDLFLSTNSVREEIMNEGNIQYDDHCRACHKLGDLLCCETCSAVYHLACVEPPMEEVPEEDWVCTICKAHKVKGVTDCASEAEKSGLLCRQEPIGFDRHRRKYWFLCRRIVVESEDSVWYYSTKPQFDELLEVLDKNNYEKDLVMTLLEFKEDVLKHMSITEELTNSHKGNRKSALEIEIGQLQKTQTERAARKAKEEEERKAREEEEARQMEEERIQREIIDLDGPEMNGDINENSNSRPMNFNSSVVEEVVMSEEMEVIATTSEVTTSQTIVSEAGKTEAHLHQLVETVTTTTVKTVTSTKVSNSEEAMETDSGDQTNQPNDDVILLEKNGQGPNPDLKSFEIKKVDKTPDGVKSTIMNVQSVCPNVKPTVLKVTEDSSQKSPQTRTVLIVNRDGNRVTLAVSKQPITSSQSSDGIDTVVTQNSTENTTVVSSSDARRIVTRSKTGSLTPKQFTDSVTSTTATIKNRSSDDVLVINKDGDITRVTRSKSALMTHQSVYFKLGMENNFKTYQNQYSSNPLALNKHQHNEERDKRRYLSHKFSLTQLSEFKWNGTLVGRKNLVINTLMMTITQLENNIPTAFLHPHWPLHRTNWNNAVQLCRSPADFGLALSILEACMKPVLFNPVWTEALGHSKLMKITSLDREEMKKREKELRKKKEEDEESRGPLVWIKYTLGLKHQVWKQRGEEYRVTGGQGWLWVSKTRQGNFVSQDSVGLRNVARKLQARKRKAEEKQEENQEDSKEESTAKKVKEEGGQESTETIKEEGKMEVMQTVKEENSEVEVYPQGEKMDVDEKPVETKKEEDSGESGTKEDKVESGETPQLKTENRKNEVFKGNTKKTDNDQDVTIDIETSSPVKHTKVSSIIETSKVTNDFSATGGTKESGLPPKADVDLINVTKGMNERTFYPKVTKPYAKLDSLLVKRLKQEEIEIKQRQALQQQINWKLKSQLKTEPDQHSIKTETVKMEENKPFTDTSTSEESEDLPSFTCYSYLCRSGEGSCYSCLCMQQQSEDEAMMNLTGNTQQENTSDTEMEEDEEEEDVDVEGDGKPSPQKIAPVKEEKAEVKQEEEKMDTTETDHKIVKSEPETKSIILKPVGSTSSTGTAAKTTSSAVAQILSQKTGLKANQMTQAQQALRQAIDKMSVEELRSKMPPLRTTKEPIKLVKFAKMGQRLPAKKKATLPSCHKFLTPSGRKTLFALEKHELRKMSRKGGKCETKAFNYNCKMNNVNWIYPCPRPVFKTAWRYRTQTSKSYGAVGIQLRILWACLRWDDLAVKPPAGGTNTISTETEITTKELLKRRDVGPHNLRSEFLVRKIVVPLGVPTQPKEKYTPQRSGLRERKRAESPKQTEPSVTEHWTPEEELELWEIKQFGEKLARQRAAIQEKSSQDTVQVQQTTSVNAAQLKAQLEQQLKQQRLALQQKRLLEAQGKIAPVSTSAPSIISATLNSASGGTVIKTLGGAVGSSLLSGATSILKTVQPKTLSAITVNPSGVVTTNGGTPIRPVVKVQLPMRSSLQTSSGVTLAPKPGSIVVSTAQPSTLTRLIVPISKPQLTPTKVNVIGSQSLPTTPARVIVPSSVQTPPSSVPKLQIRPTGSPGTQNLQIIQGPSGQLQVRGLMQGQQIIRLPDGRLQLLTLPQSGATTQVVTTSVTSSPQASLASTLVPPRGQLAIRPTSSVLVSTSTGLSALTGTTPTRIIVPSQALSSGGALQLGNSTIQTKQLLAQSLAGLGNVTSVDGTATLVKPATTTVQAMETPKLVASLSTPSAAVPGTNVAATLLSPLKLTSVTRPILVSSVPTLPKQTSSSISIAPPSTVLLPVKVSTAIAATTTTPRLVSPPQTIQQQLVLQKSPPQAVTSSPRTTTVAPSTPTSSTKYAVTPQVVQQVVRQALMQNQTPEIQAKLLAMQRMMQNPSASPIPPPQPVVEKPPTVVTTAAPVQQLDPATKQMTQEQREERMRRAVCGAVLKSIVEKIEKKEKEEVRKVKKQELEEEKQKRLMFEVAEQLKKRQGQSQKRVDSSSRQANQAVLTVQQHIASGNKKAVIPAEQIVKSKRKKQKIISTGSNKSLNPRSRLYCVCKQPYDDTKFYIGCDLCSNWFHGSCVNISEDMAKKIDTYVCDECKKQRDTATEELYCLCRTPYDDTQFYIGCDRCQDWFHGRCVGVSQVEANHMDIYICPNCEKKEEVDPISQKILQEKDYENVRRLVKSMQSHKMAWPFLEPVDRIEVPDYYAVIKDPMDLQTLEKNVMERKYLRLCDFVKDVTKVFDNCRLYNPADTPFYQCAEVLETFFVQRLKSLKERI